MPASALRTLVVAGQPLLWPNHDATEELDYSLNVQSRLADVPGDSIVRVAVSVAPSGQGELRPSAVSCAGGLITVWLSGGVYRLYQVRVRATTAQDREFTWPVAIRAIPDLAVWPVPQPGSRDFGDETMWPPSSMVNFGLVPDLVFLAAL